MFALGIEAAAIIAQFHANPLPIEHETRCKMTGVRVPERVRQNLLSDAEEIFVPLGRKFPWRAL